MSAVVSEMRRKNSHTSMRVLSGGEGKKGWREGD